MNLIRAFVYWIGLTPKFGSIFYSPSRHWTMRVGKTLSGQHLSKKGK